MPSITSAFKTDVGLVRKENQDSVSTHEAFEFDSKIDGLFVVADGMGGMAGGAVASRLTVETIPAIVAEALEDRSDPLTDRQLASLIRDALETANDTVWTQARANPELRGMGTTVVAVAILDNKALLASVGDSRIYLFRGGALSQVTHDHSLVAEQVRAGQLTADEARNSRFSNVITRAIGIAATVEPELQLLELHVGDTLLLCSDGLTNMVEVHEIAATIGQNSDLDKVCKSLVEQAINGGGKDNITAALIRFGDFVPSSSIPATIDEPALSVVADNSSPSPMIIQAAPRKRSSMSSLIGLIAVLALGALTYVLPKAYNFSSDAPYIIPKPPIVKIQSVEPPKLDFAKLVYDKAVVVSKKPLKSSPLMVDETGNILGISKETGAVITISPDSKFKKFGPPDIAPETNPNTRYWAMDRQGNLYVSTKSAKAIYKFDNAGTRIGTIGDGELKVPESIAISGDGSVFVIDSGLLKLFKAHAPTADSTVTSVPSTPITDTNKNGASDSSGSNGNGPR